MIFADDTVEELKAELAEARHREREIRELIAQEVEAYVPSDDLTESARRLLTTSLADIAAVIRESRCVPRSVVR